MVEKKVEKFWKIIVLFYVIPVVKCCHRASGKFMRSSWLIYAFSSDCIVVIYLGVIKVR